MLADRDSVGERSKIAQKASGRFQTLAKYHLENYFLDENILARVFRIMEPADSWLCDPYQIAQVLKDIARKHIPYAVTLIVANERRRISGNVDLMLKSCQGKTKDELIAMFSERSAKESMRVQAALDASDITASVAKIYESLEKAIEDNDGKWKSDIPGKALFNTFCNRAKIPEGRLKTLYIQESEKSTDNPFAEVVQIFADFAGHST